MNKPSNAIQGSEEWAQERCGLATSSNFSAILAKGEGKTRRKYLLQVVGEILTGKPHEGFSSKHLDRGTEHEPFARIAYEAKTLNIVHQVGFLRHEYLACGCSSDGWVGEDGIVEIKNVLPHIQIETIEKGGLPTEHKAQVQGNLWIGKKTFCDFVSHCEDLPDPFKTYIFRVDRDEAYIKNLESEVERFLAEVNVTIADLRRKAA